MTATTCLRLLAAVAFLSLATCVDHTTTAPTPSAARVNARAGDGEGSVEPRFSPELAAMNVRLEAMGAPYRVAQAEYVTATTSG